MKILLVLLAILKYTLLFVLFLLLLIIVIALILLISPIRYTATVRYKDEDLYLHINATYLGKIVGFNFKLKKGKRQVVLRLLNKKINLSPDAKIKKASSKNSTNLDDLPLKTVQKVTPTETLEAETKDRLHKKNHDTSNTFKKNYSTSKIEQELEDEAEKTKSDDVNSFESEVKENKYEEKENKDEQKEGIFNKINKLIDKINFYIESYKTYPYRDKLIKEFKKIFSNLFDSLIPKHFDISGLIYISSPSTTGQILGAMYILHGKYARLNVTLDADFENEKNDVTALISGRIIIFKIIQPVISFVWIGLKAEAKRRKITRIQLIKILINNE